MDPSRPWDSGWRWWAKVALIVAGSVAAAGLITFGAARFLDAADAQHDRVECIRVGLQQQAGSNARMASVVLDPRIAVEDRRAAVATWSDEQSAVAERIGRC